jgi:hypothetical protein
MWWNLMWMMVLIIYVCEGLGTFKIFMVEVANPQGWIWKVFDLCCISWTWASNLHSKLATHCIVNVVLGYVLRGWRHGTTLFIVFKFVYFVHFYPFCQICPLCSFLFVLLNFSRHVLILFIYYWFYPFFQLQVNCQICLFCLM